jgi:hypothetical protein
MPDKKLTPMMELIEWVKEDKPKPFDVLDPVDILNKATELLEKERQMVVDAVNNIDKKNITESNNAIRVYSKNKITEFFLHDGREGEQYYTQTYKS